MAGNVASHSLHNCTDAWIIGTGATDHMTSNLHQLTNVTNTYNTMTSNVYLPNGKTVPVDYQGTCHIAGG